ncbi:MAG: 23S rRNA methyltransferase [Chromatiaceae bacterium]|nr:MAG: 23S rRNA methyltransferase [Chromatiaceae bacterium]
MPGTKESRRKSRRPWLDRHLSDPYVQQAQRDGYRSRAAYKLLEIDRKDRLLRRGQRVVDLGAAPGGWSQVAHDLVGPAGQVIAMDLLPMDPIPGVDFLQGDFREADDYARLQQLLGGALAHLVLSDMAPNLSGMQAVDQPRMSNLVELAAEFADLVLQPGGALLVKAFHGEGFDGVLKRLRTGYAAVAVRKPAASRPESREVYLVAKGRRTS